MKLTDNEIRDITEHLEETLQVNLFDLANEGTGRCCKGPGWMRE